MNKETIIEKLGFERAVDLNGKKSSDSQKEILNQVEYFGIDKVYFSQDGKKCYPAVFLKKVISFDEETLKEIAEIHKKVWNYKKVLFLYVYNDVEIRIYNCVETPHHKGELKSIELTSCKLSDKENFATLLQIFSAVAVDSGVIWSTEKAVEFKNKIQIKRRVDQYLVESLTKITEELKKDLNVELIHRLILRSLFLLYLEDRGATDVKFYSKIKKEAKNYFDILKDVNSTYLLFEKLEEHFNGNVFSVEESEKKNVKNKHLEIIRKCFISGYENIQQLEMFDDFRLFKFNIIQIELLSQIYENFLAKVAPKEKKSSGTFYTPPSLVELILNEKLPTNSNYKKYDIKILDPACGSGIFLVESFKRLVKRYENNHKKKLTDFEKLKRLLTENIYGIEIDSNAIKVAAFSLYLALVDCLDPKTLWQGKKLPNLINDPNDKTLKSQGKNLFKRDAIEENKEIDNINFDLVVGNPPFGTTDLKDSIRNYCNKQQFAMEMVLPFLHKAIKFAPKGEIAMIFNTKILTNTGSTYQEFRKWLLKKCYVEKIYNFSILRKAPKDFGGQLFSDAVGPISIVFYKKEIPKKTDSRIVYYAPKTYIKSNILEGIVIDSTDVKYLPREECEKPDTKIWKIAMWGGMADFNLINKIYSNYENKTLIDIFNDKKLPWKYATGLNSDSKHQDFIPKLVIDTKKIDRYYSPNFSCYENRKTYRNLNEHFFKPPFIVIKQAQLERQMAASYIDYKAYCLSSAYVINGIGVSDIKKKALVAIFNSTFIKYFLFMIASSWGIERERVQFNEILSLPYLLNTDDSNMKKMSNLIDKIISIKKENKIFNENEISNVEEEIDNLLFNDILKLSKNEQTNIKEVLKYNLDLFEKQQKSKALLPVLDTKQYAEMLCSELNEFMDDKTLFANATIYNKSDDNPLSLVKISFEKKKRKIELSNEDIDKKLKEMNKYLWKKEATNIYFRKKLNYYDGDDIYIIRPNQRRFWSQTMAMEDASELILEILNMEN